MYINLITKNYPVTEQEVKALYQNTSFPVPFVAPAPFAWVHRTAQPAYDEVSQGIEELEPTEVNGQWEQQWRVFDLSADLFDANTKEQQRKLTSSIVEQTQNRLDDFARTRSYDGILSACTYATSSVPKFQAEGQYCVVARDETWATLYTILAEVEAGVYPMPTSFADIEPELPALVWP